MPQEVQLEDLVNGLVEDYVSRNPPALVMRAALNDAGVGLYPVLDHITVRVEDIDASIQKLTSKGVRFTGDIVGERGGDLQQIFSVPEEMNGELFSVLELTERHHGYQGLSPPQPNKLMQSTVANNSFLSLLISISEIAFD